MRRSVSVDLCKLLVYDKIQYGDTPTAKSKKIVKNQPKNHKIIQKSRYFGAILMGVLLILGILGHLPYNIKN